MKIRSLVQETIDLLLPDSNTVSMNHKVNMLGTDPAGMQSR
jgi:hypothetical protein